MCCVGTNFLNKIKSLTYCFTGLKNAANETFQSYGDYKKKLDILKGKLKKLRGKNKDLVYTGVRYFSYTCFAMFVTVRKSTVYERV